MGTGDRVHTAQCTLLYPGKPRGDGHLAGLHKLRVRLLVERASNTGW